MTSYVCGEHSTEAVTWKGTGCRICAKPIEERLRDEATALASQQWQELHADHVVDEQQDNRW